MPLQGWEGALRPGWHGAQAALARSGIPFTALAMSLSDNIIVSHPAVSGRCHRWLAILHPGQSGTFDWRTMGDDSLTVIKISKWIPRIRWMKSPAQWNWTEDELGTFSTKMAAFNWSHLFSRCVSCWVLLEVAVGLAAMASKVGMDKDQDWNKCSANTIRQWNYCHDMNDACDNSSDFIPSYIMKHWIQYIQMHMLSLHLQKTLWSNEISAYY